MKARSSAAVMARRNVPRDGRDYYATPPWATRALVDVLVDRGLLRPDHRIADPACGGGHMVGALRERGHWVEASDKFDYGWGHQVCDFLGPGWRAGAGGSPDWIITNPPYSRATDFVETGYRRAVLGLALLVRLSFLEGEKRYRRLFDPTSRSPLQPALILPFSSRVTMRAGGWWPGQRGGATSYAWFVWTLDQPCEPTVVEWMPWDAAARYGRPLPGFQLAADDVRFAGEVAPCVRA